MGSRKLRLLESRRLLTLLLFGAFAWSLSGVDWLGPTVHTGGPGALLRFIQALFPPELSPGFLRLALVASFQTTAYAVAAITVAVIVAVPMGLLASGAAARSAKTRLPIAVAARLGLGAIRSVHELVWAVLFVSAFGLSSLTAILALSLPYAGILGRIYAELLNDVPESPLRALRSSGASPFKVFLFGRLPMAFPDMLSYTFYRFECAIRSAAILSFVGIQGLGYQIQLSLHDLLFNQVWTLMLALVGLVVAVDLWSTRVRRSLVA